MTKGGSKKMKIKVETATGKTLEVVDEKGRKATVLTPAQVQAIYDKGGFKYVGTILHAHSSPGCVYYFFAGQYWAVCW